MALNFDMHILSLSNQVAGELATPGIVGLYIETKARHAHRHRQDDWLILQLSLIGNLTLSPEKQTQLLQRLSQVYYKTSGAVTGALRVVSESLNHFLLERNGRASGEENRVIGYLNQLVIHADRLTFAQSGLTHAYWINKDGATHLYDPDLAGGGLGINKSAAVRYFQCPINAGDSLILTLQPSLSWDELFLGSLYGQGPESIRRKLIQNNIDKAEGIVIQLQSGTGKTIYLPVKPLAKPNLPETSELKETTAADTVSQVGELAEPTPQPQIVQEPKKETEGIEVAISEMSTETEQTFPPVAVSEVASTAIPPKGVTAGADNLSSLTGKELPSIHQPEQGLSSVDVPKKSIAQPKRAAFWGAISPTLHKGIEKIKPLENIFQIPTSIMAIIAILVPLIVVAITSAIYLRQGRVSEFAGYYALAQQSSAYAQGQSDPLTQRTAWIAVLKYLDQAEQYGQSPAAQTLRAKAQTALDQLDFIQRLDFMPALSEGLASDAQIVKMIATENELFLLDATSGVVWRAETASRGYVLHPETSCGPGINGLAMGKLIGFSVEKRVNEVYSVIRAADAKGNVVTCPANQNPHLDKLTPPDNGLGSLTGFLVERGNFYGLDPQKNAVWIYWGGKTNQKPELFFSQDIPPMKNILDFAVSQDDLYLLYQDGHLVQCAYNAVTPTRCNDPQPYKDSRPGRVNQVLKTETPFNRVFASQPPDPALYFLEPNTPAIYQFSLRSLAFHVQYRQNPLSTYTTLPRAKPASAIAISTDHRLAFLAYGNQIYYASLP